MTQGWGAFSSHPRVELLDDGRRVRICDTFAYTRANGGRVTVPRDFVCDGASIPRIAWPIAGGPFEGQHRNAALVHDYLHALGARGEPACSRATADRIFYEAMRCRGVSAFHSRAKYLAVRAFGPRWTGPEVLAP